MAKAREFKVGEIVQLKSGGPKMTIDDPHVWPDKIRCHWFSGGKLNSGDFSAETLEYAKESEEK
jgi:uncharacterized protein YodC (DUF2158 family)